MEAERVLLIDDVSTTGATLGACRVLLKSAGAQIVHTAVVARTESRGIESSEGVFSGNFQESS